MTQTCSPTPTRPHGPAISDAPKRSLRTLGELRWGEYRETKPLLLLAYLTLEGPTARQELARLLWPEVLDVENTLRVVRACLKRQGIPIHQDGELWSTDITCDALELFHLRGSDVAGHAGDVFLNNVRLRSVAPAFEDWIVLQRERLACHLQRELVRAALQQRGEAAHTLAEQAWNLPDSPPPDGYLLAQLLMVCPPESKFHAQLQRELGEYGWPPALLDACLEADQPAALHALLAWWLEGGALWLAGDPAHTLTLVDEWCHLLDSDGLPSIVLEVDTLTDEAQLIAFLRKRLHPGRELSHLTVVLKHLDQIAEPHKALEAIHRLWPEVRFVYLGQDFIEHPPVFQLCFFPPVQIPTRHVPFSASFAELRRRQNGCRRMRLKGPTAYRDATRRTGPSSFQSSGQRERSPPSAAVQYASHGPSARRKG